MRFPKDDRSSDAPKLRGYGYVEFEDRDSLISALSMPDCVSIISKRSRSNSNTTKLSDTKKQTY